MKIPTEVLFTSALTEANHDVIASATSSCVSITGAIFKKEPSTWRSTLSVKSSYANCSQTPTTRRPVSHSVKRSSRHSRYSPSSSSASLLLMRVARYKAALRPSDTRAMAPSFHMSTRHSFHDFPPSHTRRQLRSASARHSVGTT